MKIKNAPFHVLLNMPHTDGTGYKVLIGDDICFIPRKNSSLAVWWDVPPDVEVIPMQRIDDIEFNVLFQLANGAIAFKIDASHYVVIAGPHRGVHTISQNSLVELYEKDTIQL